MSAQNKQDKENGQPEVETIASKLDLRGLMCPEPVLRTKKVLDGKPKGKVEVLVDSDINVMNLSRLANSLGLKLESEQNQDGFRVLIGTQPTEKVEPGHIHSHIDAVTGGSTQTNGTAKGIETTTVVFISKDTFGEGDRDFSVNLLNVFLQTMLEAGHRPQAILLANTGVRLMDPDSSVRKVLQDFQQAGVQVFACGLCVEFYGLKDKIAKEQITNMYAICEYLFSAGKVLSP